jgi:hypothetical protein
MIRRIQFSLYSNHYRYLTNEGIQYLRDYLHLPPEIVPTTLKRQARAEARPGGGERRGGERRDKGPEGDRAAYRRAPGGDDKAGAAGPGSAPMEFVSLKIFASGWCKRLFEDTSSCGLLAWLMLGIVVLTK